MDFLKSRRAFKFESLEDRVCLSVSAHSITAVSAVHGHTHPTRLTGTLRIANPSSDANNNSIQGTGSVRPLGAVSYSGTATVSPSGETGSGELTLSGQQGSLSLHLAIGPREA